MTGREKSLDHALRDDRDVASDLAPLVDTAHELEAHFDAEIPAAANQRALFVEAVAARNRPRPRLLLPALTATAVVFILGFAAGSALPGDRIYPVRRAMASVGLVASPTEQLEASLRDAARDVSQAEALQSRSPKDALAEAFGAIGLIEEAARLVTDVPRDERFTYEQTIAALRDRAAAVIAFVADPEVREERSGRDGGDDDRSGPSDNSGPGSDDSGDDDDNSGPGSGDDDNDADDTDDDDNSGPGSGDDDDDADDTDDSDNSGPGSDDSDNSGSGSDDSDNSGSGSDDLDDFEEEDSD